MDINKETQQEQIEYVSNKIRDEGFHYCFNSYSDFPNIEDKKFHKLRLAYIKSADKLENYVNSEVKRFRSENEEEI